MWKLSHDVGHSFLWVCMSASQKIPLFWRETHTNGLRARSLTRPEEDEGRQGPRAVNRREQSTEVMGKVTAIERWLLSEESGPVNSEARSANARRWVSVPGGCVWTFEYTLVTHKCRKSVTNFSLLALGVNPSPWLFVLLFFHLLGCVCCVLCVCKAMWNAPGRRLEKPLDDRMVMSCFRRLRYRDWSAGILSQNILFMAEQNETGSLIRNIKMVYGPYQISQSDPCFSHGQQYV